jgi:hypothetical protein
LWLTSARAGVVRLGEMTKSRQMIVSLVLDRRQRTAVD